MRELINYDQSYFEMIDKIKNMSLKMPARSLEDIIGSYIQATGITISADRIRRDVVMKIANDIGCSVCGEYGKMFKVGDEDDICDACKPSGSSVLDEGHRDMVTQPSGAMNNTMASIPLSIRVAEQSNDSNSLSSTLEIIKGRLEIIGADNAHKILGRNIQMLMSEFKRVLSGGDREFRDFSFAGGEAVPAILERVFVSHNLGRATQDTVVNDSAIREAISNLIGEPVHQEANDTETGIDDLSSTDLVKKDDANVGGLLSAVEAIGG